MSTAKIQCIGVIMDGNRRWAKGNDLPSIEGHRRGYAKLKEFLGWSRDLGVQAVIAYAFSKENWKRTEEEIGFLMDLFRYALQNEIGSLIKEKTRLKFIGNKEAFPEDIRRLMNEAEEKTKDYEGTILCIAASYGGREEIVQAAKNLGDAKDADEAVFQTGLWTNGLPDPDIILRTGGEKRLSGFLPWQSTYSELFFVDTLWPAYDKNEFDLMIKEFRVRKRNFGK